MPKIGIVGNFNSDNQLWINHSYVDYFEQFGDTSIINPYTERVKGYDLLVLPGGSDVNPSRYGSLYHKEVSLPNRAYEYFDQAILPQYIQAQIPVFGICRGLQTLNVLFGGTLHPHVSEPSSYNDGCFAHFVKMEESFSDDNNYYSCSSNHHQAIAKLADGFEVVAWGYDSTHSKGNYDPNPTKRLQIEAIRHKELNIMAVQFHPEKNFNGEDSLQINEVLVKPMLEKLMA
jgi:putative glutamine amidotransferase